MDALAPHGAVLSTPSSASRKRSRPKEAFSAHVRSQLCCLFHSCAVVYHTANLTLSLTTSHVGTQFISSRGNEYFCEIDEDYLTDRFNLTGLNTEVQYYQYALDLVTDVFDLDCDDEMRETIEKSARHLYGLVHARFIVTTRGLAKMVRRVSMPSHSRIPCLLTRSGWVC